MEKSGYVYVCAAVNKGRNIIKQNFKSGGSQNALLSKLIGYMPNNLPYGGSDFTVAKDAFGKAALLKIDRVKRVAACNEQCRPP